MKINLNLTYLKCFYDAVLMGSVSESARRNFVSQSAVSQAIAKLEKSLGVALCTHKKQQFKVTTEGEIVFQKAKEIFSSVRNLQNALDQKRDQPQMPLNFVTTHSIGLAILPNFVPSFHSLYPKVDTHFQLGGLSQIKGWLKQGIAEFALVLQSPHVAEYQNIPIYSGKFGLYKNKNEKKQSGQLGIYVEHTEGLMVQEFQNEYEKTTGKLLPIRAELNSWEFIARSLEDSKGFGLLPDFINLKGRYTQLELQNKVTVDYVLCAIFLKGEELSFSAKTFLDELKNNLNNTAKSNEF